MYDEYVPTRRYNRHRLEESEDNYYLEKLTKKQIIRRLDTCFITRTTDKFSSCYN